MAVPLIVLGAIFLTLDLARPERFWHMLVQSETGWPMFKWWSPISFGSWAITVFGAFAFLSFLGALAEDGYLRRWPALLGLRRSTTGGLLAVIGGALALFVAGYTGILLTVTNRPVWADTGFLGLLFLVSGVSTAAALITLLGLPRGAAVLDPLHRLSRMDAWLLGLEFIVLVALVLSLGSLAGAALGWTWGLTLALGVALFGILVPLVLEAWRPGRLALPTAAVLVLIGGFLLRVVIVLSSEGTGLTV